MKRILSIPLLAFKGIDRYEDDPFFLPTGGRQPLKDPLV
jgi:hypothetical protein